jgi:hypothetical protein
MTVRVVQWATGSIGRVTLRHVIDSPELELVGLKVHSAKKAGRDAGDIVRRPATGVIATDRIEDILCLDADVVLHVPLNGESPDEHVEDIERLLRSGKNVITTVGFTYPWAVSRERAEQLEAAALAGGVTLYGTGMNPGFLSERLAVSITTLCTQVKSISVQELYDCTPVASPGFIFELCGFGKTEQDFWESSAGRVDFFASLFGESLGFLIETLQLPVDGIGRDHKVMLADSDLELPAGVIPAGTVCGVRWQWHALEDGEPVITVRAIWRCGPPAPGWEGEDGWQVRVEGAPRLELDLQWLDPIGLPERSKAVQYTTAGPVVRAIPDVVAAAPGILVPPTFAHYRGPGSGVEDLTALIAAGA